MMQTCKINCSTCNWKWFHLNGHSTVQRAFYRFQFSVVVAKLCTYICVCVNIEQTAILFIFSLSPLFVGVSLSRVSIWTPCTFVYSTKMNKVLKHCYQNVDVSRWHQFSDIFFFSFLTKERRHHTERERERRTVVLKRERFLFTWTPYSQ